MGDGQLQLALLSEELVHGGVKQLEQGILVIVLQERSNRNLASLQYLLRVLHLYSQQCDCVA